jgi:GTP cyclohydrolase I
MSGHTHDGGSVSRPTSCSASPDAIDAVRTLLRFAGADPHDPDLLDTPARYLRALAEMTSGRNADIKDILSAQFEAGGCDTVEASGIAFSSLCPHHLLPWFGVVTIRYRPCGRVAGLSKLARLVDALARRLVLQERLAADIADAIVDHLGPHGVSCRGVRQPGMRVAAKAVRGHMKEAAGG